MFRTIFHVDMDSFFASCEQQADPRLRGRPIAVSGDPKSRTVVAAASKEAKKWGVKSGMPIRDARALCPHIQFVLGDPDKYADVSRRIMAILRSYTEDMEIFSIDEAFLDVTRGEVEGEKQAVAFALDMKRRIRAEVGECVTCSIGVASNKRLAKLASEYRKPDGLVVVTDTSLDSPHPVRRGSERGWFVDATERIANDPIMPPPLDLPLQDGGGETESLSPSVRIVSTSDLLSSLKLRDLCGIGARIEARLHDLGIWTVSGLAAAPVELLTREFGVYGAELHDMAHGRDTSPVVAGDADPKSVGHAATLPRDIHTLDEARPIIAELAEKVAARLRRYGFRGATVHLTVRFRDFSGTSEQRSIGAPTDDGLVIAREAIGMLEGVMISPPPTGRGRVRGGGARAGIACAGVPFTMPPPLYLPLQDGGGEIRPPIRLLGISVSSLTPRNPWQQPIFPKSRRWTEVTQALDAVNDRYGDWTLQRATLLRPIRYLRKAAAAFRATRHLKEEQRIP